MQHGDFIWTDLSTFDVARAKRFYQAVLGWDYVDIGDGYQVGSATDAAAAAIYEMPPFFVKIKMPSFWMPYIKVDAVEPLLTIAKQHGAKVELELDQQNGKAVLIRDPAGAGFTCYTGTDLAGRSAPPLHGHHVWNELHVSDLAQVEPLYKALFGWQIVPIAADTDRYAILNKTGERIGSVQVLANDVKGEKEYWTSHFAVADLAQAIKQIRWQGGQIISDDSTSDGRQVMAYDNQGAAFFLRQQSQTPPTQTETTAPPKKSTWKWRTVLGLVLVYTSVLFEWNWLWGIFFLLWVLPDLRSGSTYFLEIINRRENPILYWLIMVTWLSLSVWMMLDVFTV